MDKDREPGAFGAHALLLAVALALGGAVGLGYAVVAPGSSSPLAAAALVVPALFFAELALRVLASRGASRRGESRPEGGERAAQELSESCMDLRSEAELASAIDDVLARHFAFEKTSLYRTRADGAWQRVGAEAGAPLHVDASLTEELREDSDAIAARHLGGRGRGDVRAASLDLLRDLEAEILIPLVDRDRLLGAITVGFEGASRMRGALERGALAGVQQAATRTLTYLELLREAETRVGEAREGEVAAAVQQARGPGLHESLSERISITSHYQPAEAFGGDVFSAAELADGRTFVAIGDVAGRGMPAALISASVAGAFEATERLLPSGAAIVEVVDHVNRLIGAVGRDRYAMSCFFALFDSDAGRVTFADAGHPFPYVCRSRDDRGPELRALVARGVPLGLEQRPHIEVASFDLEEGDAIVLYTDAVVEAVPSAGGAPYGDRRLRRLLRRRAESGSLCRDVVDDVLEYCGGRPLHDDMTVAVVRVGAPPSRPS